MNVRPEPSTPQLAKTLNKAPAVMAEAEFTPFSLAATPTVKTIHDEDHARWNRLRAICLVLIPMSIVFMEGPLSVLQTASIPVGLPVLIVLCLGVAALFSQISPHRLEKLNVAFQAPSGEQGGQP